MADTDRRIQCCLSSLDLRAESISCSVIACCQPYAEAPVKHRLNLWSSDYVGVIKLGHSILKLPLLTIRFNAKKCQNVQVCDT